MKQRQLNKKRKSAMLPTAPKPSLQEAFNVVAETLAATGKIAFFIEPNWDGDSNCFRLHELTGFELISKPVRGLS